MKIYIGSRKWEALQSMLDERKDCADNITLFEAIVCRARIYRTSAPIYTDDITRDSYTTLGDIIDAMRLFCDVTTEEAENA